MLLTHIKPSIELRRSVISTTKNYLDKGYLNTGAIHPLGEASTP